MMKVVLSLLAAVGVLGPVAAFGQTGEALTLIPQGAVWRYSDTGVNLGTTWRQRIYAAETNWNSGAAQLGFGDDDEATVVNGGPSSARYNTIYFRRSFVLADPGPITNLVVSLLRDDGGVVYLNGTEVFRSNMPLPPTTISYSTLALNAVPNADETVNFYSQTVDPNLLIAGTNVVAVEIHQQGPTSSDLSFDLRLEAIRVPSVGPPNIFRQPQNRSVLAGSNTTFQVGAAGTAPLRYQWSLNGTNLSGGTNSTLALTSVGAADAGAYRVFITNSLGAMVSSNAALTVLDFDSGVREDVEPNVHSYFWSQFTGTILGATYGGSVSGSNSLWFGGDGNRTAVTRPFDTSLGAAVEFYLRMADSSGTSWETPDLPGEGIVLEYSTNAGVSWVNLATWDSVLLTSWTHQFLELPAAAQSTQTLLRWRQLANSGDCCDNWALDDITVALPPSAPRILGQPTDQVAAVGFSASFSLGVAGVHPLSYQWRFNGNDIAGATNATLVLTNLTFGDAGQYSVFLSNALGTATSSNATLSIEDLGAEFRIVSLSTNNAHAIDHIDLTGGERGGFALCNDHLLYSGEYGIAGFGLDDFALDATVPTFTGLIASDLETGLAYALANGSNLVTSLSGAQSFDSLQEISPATGQLTGRRLALTSPISVSSSYGYLGLFSGWGRIVVHNRSRAYNISTRSGLVTDLGAMTMPTHTYSSGLGAYWGVAEYFSNAIHVVYARNSFTITRTRIPDGFNTNVLSVVNGAGLGSISQLSALPHLNRWYFHHQYSSVFLSGSEVLGYADASFAVSPSARAPVIVSQPTSQAGAAGAAITLRIGVSGSSPLEYQWRFNGDDLPNATNSILTISPLMSDVAGTYSVRVSNQAGSVQSSNATLSILTLPADKFQITRLGTNNPYVVDHELVTGDNRGALVISSNQVFCSGDSSTARFKIGDLSQGTGLGRIFDALVSDLQSERIYSLANGTNVIGNSAVTNLVTHLIEHDSDTGLLTTNRIALSSSIPLPANYNNIGLFSGFGRIVIFDGANVYHIALPSGQVTFMGTLPTLAHSTTESWAYWGVAEFFNSALHLVYVRNSSSIARTRVGDGFTTTLGRFNYLGNMAAFTVSPNNGRWYFHFSGSSQFGSGNESIGFADAILKYSAPPLPPRLLSEPISQTAVLGSTVRFKVGASGTAPLAYQWWFNGDEIPGANSSILTLSNISGADVGDYAVIVENEYGTRASSNATLNAVGLPGELFRVTSLNPSNAYMIETWNLTSYDRGGMAASSSRIFYNGTVATAGYDLEDLSNGAISPTRGDALVSDLRTEILYALGNGAAPLTYGGGVANSLIQLDSYTGETTTNIIPLSSPVEIATPGGNMGLFSGWGRVALHNGVRAYDIQLPSGQVTELGLMNIPGHNRTSGWAYWGVAEYYEGLIYLVFVQDYYNIVRVRVPDGVVTTILESQNYLGNMNCIAVSPYRNRWFFHHEYYSWFSGSSFNETLGLGDATFEFVPSGSAPTVVSEPADRLAIGSRPFSLGVAASGRRPLAYQWQFNDTDIPGATNATLVFAEASTENAGAYRVVVSNELGTVTSRNATVTVRDLFSVSRNFAITALMTNNSRVVDHNTITGDDRGGIALSGSAVFYTGDISTGRFLAGDLSSGLAVNRIYDALVSNLRTETVYSLAQGATVLTRTGGVATALIQLDPLTGAQTTAVIPLSSPIVLSNLYSGSIGFFSGYDRIVIYNGQRVYSIELPDGAVFDHGAMTSPTHRNCDNWAYWGVAEQIDNSIYITYARDSLNIYRTHVPDGASTVLARFNNLSDMCSFTVSRARNRWYFHHEGVSQFGGTTETIGYADASFESPPSISGLHNFTILEDSALGPLPFRVYDASGQSNITTVIAISSNTNLVASSNIVIAGDGTDWSLSAAPFANSNGTSTITVVAQIGTHSPISHSFILTVTPVNDAPTFTIPPSLTILEDSGYQSSYNWITNLSAGPANDSSGNSQSLTMLLTNDNPSLFSTLYANYYSRYVDLYYQPAQNAFGTATITLTARDSGGTFFGGRDTTTQTFTINVLPVNDRPSFSAGPSQSVFEDAGPQLVTNWARNISAGPRETNQLLAFTLVADNPALFATQPAIDSTGNLSYTPATNATGFSAVLVTLRDDGGTNNGGIDGSFTGYLSITISPVNDPPTTSKGTDPIVLEDSGSQTISNWLSSVSGGPTNESEQSVVFDLSIDNTNLFSLPPMLDTNGTLSFVAATNAFGTANGTIRLEDSGGVLDGGKDTTLIPFTIAILPVNDAPSFTAGPDQTLLADAGPQALSNWATAMSAGPENESNQTLTFVVSNSNPRLFLSQPAIASNGTLTFTPARNGDGAANVFVTLHDNGGTTNGGVDVSTTAVCRITVIAVAHAPYANSQTITLNEDTPTAIALSVGDIDGDPLSYTITSPLHGTLSGAPPNLIYSPALNYSGSDSFTFQASDGALQSDVATLSITVQAVNDGPAAVARAFGTTQLGTNQTNCVFLAPDNLQAMITFDASRTTDTESNSFQCFWYEQGETNAFAFGLRVTNAVEIGSYTIVLYAWDGGAGGADHLQLEVITPEEAVARVMVWLENATASRTSKESLIASLKNAAKSYDKRNLHPAINQLLALQNKIKAQLQPYDPAIAGELNAQVQQIIDALSDYAAPGRIK